MSKVRNTSKEISSNPMLALMMAMDGAEAQEREGQHSLNHSDQLPKSAGGWGDTNAAAQYESMGIKVIGPTEGDEIFLDVILPEGWKKQGTDHARWNNLLDDKGRVRAQYFYKAAFYDRSAHVNFCTRYNYNLVPFLPQEEKGHYEIVRVESEPEFMHDDFGLLIHREAPRDEKGWIKKYKDSYEEYNNTPLYFEITDSEKVIYTSKDRAVFYTTPYDSEHHREWWSGFDAMKPQVQEEAIAHMQQNYPDWETLRNIGNRHEKTAYCEIGRLRRICNRMGKNSECNQMGTRLRTGTICH